jgi:hypothetical protein
MPPVSRYAAKPAHGGLRDNAALYKLSDISSLTPAVSSTSTRPSAWQENYLMSDCAVLANDQMREVFG